MIEGLPELRGAQGDVAPVRADLAEKHRRDCGVGLLVLQGVDGEAFEEYLDEDVARHVLPLEDAAARFR
ncbi:hypothetical protein CVT25_008446 [Psilocybe cyanescens]|uniref:Uncharacterized protein n=1 Tax=Psilocybe cyanescens TaxID=93625 RepID=A0A409WUU6_PSICY|nr:hypothetical protein CVT25_008446 [Psilocybe cyanescens]